MEKLIDNLFGVFKRFGLVAVAALLLVVPGQEAFARNTLIASGGGKLMTTDDSRGNCPLSEYTFSLTVFEDEDGEPSGFVQANCKRTRLITISEIDCMIPRPDIRALTLTGHVTFSSDTGSVDEGWPVFFTVRDWNDNSRPDEMIGTGLRYIPFPTFRICSYLINNVPSGDPLECSEINPILEAGPIEAGNIKVFTDLGSEMDVCTNDP